MGFIKRASLLFFLPNHRNAKGYKKIIIHNYKAIVLCNLFNDTMKSSFEVNLGVVVFYALALYCLDLIKSQNKQMSHCRGDFSSIF